MSVAQSSASSIKHLVGGHGHPTSYSSTMQQSLPRIELVLATSIHLIEWPMAARWGQGYTIVNRGSCRSIAAESGDWNTCPRFDDSNNCMLQEALSQAKKLVLEVKEQDFNFKMYWQRCPTFSKLKILLISLRISAILDFEALSCILRHSPVLEKLTFQFHRVEFRQKYKVEMKGSYSHMEKSSAISEHLKIVLIQCDEIDDEVIKVLKFLSTFSIHKLTSDAIHSFYIS
uniref:F-box family-2 n=1 Tax=Oryza punctata TaxID=4537 RepID=B9V0S4_ORYPU|nr:F-box family-2 [Oryza punctata]